MNCGLVYVQNAARDGAAAWVLAELVDRSLRVWENIPGVQVCPPFDDTSSAHDLASAMLACVMLCLRHDMLMSMR